MSSTFAVRGGQAPTAPAAAPATGAEHRQTDRTDLTEVTARIREHVVTMCAGREGGHVGGSMSLVEILSVLYFRVMLVDPGFPAWPDRDVLLLSKGHGGIGLYATLAEAGYFPVERLAEYGEHGSPLMAHPNTEVPGVEMPTGSLGHGLALGIGFALANRLDDTDRRTFVVMGDGELQEGSVWEAASVAAAHRLDGLVAVVDRNGLQITGATAEVNDLEPLADRWRAFGWRVFEVDGHDVDALTDALSAAPGQDRRPTVVIARTVKGKGLPMVEDQARSHYAKLGGRQHRLALEALRKARRP
ncbi:transketolase [Actinokineospora pegani]|uniref:transketolase n=1 Tax=Actinokineospora pegani TaxID=2654637 RepID=UPI0012E9A83D|nr:transketolase [Actinokineospora pegani]